MANVYKSLDLVYEIQPN